jgi:hypothetical protein
MIKQWMLVFVPFLTASPTWAGLLNRDYYDNSRYHADFQRNDDLLSAAVGVTCRKLAGDPMPYIGQFLSKRTVVVVDPNYQRVIWNYYDPSDGSFGIRGMAVNMYYPRSLALAGTGELFISDTGNHRVIKMQAVFGPNGLTMQWIKTFGEIGTGAGQFINSFDLTISENPLRVYVSDWTNNNVQIFDGDGNYLQTIGGFGQSATLLW